MKRPKLEIAQAVLRLTTETLIPVETVSKEMGISRNSVRRWITRGRNGTFLDGVERIGDGWLTSRAALKRFQMESQKKEVSHV